MDTRLVAKSDNVPFEPIDPDFYDIVQDQIGKSGTLNFFSYEDEIEDIKGQLQEITSTKSGDFAVLKNGEKVRLDRIITIFGKPGPSFEKYNHFSNVCFSCFDEGQF